MAYKQKSVLKFGQKSAFKAKKYSPGKQVSGPDPSGEGPGPRPGVENKPKPINPSDPPPSKQKQQKADPPVEKMKGSKEKYDAMLKEWLITNRGFNQADADRMIKSGAYDWKDMMGDTPAEPKSPVPQKLQGPIPKENIDLLPNEMEGTYVYKGSNKRERIIDLDERAGFLEQNELADLEGDNSPEANKKRKELKKTIAILDHEAQLLRDRKE
jgi:hypothetical protein